MGHIKKFNEELEDDSIRVIKTLNKFLSIAVKQKKDNISVIGTIKTKESGDCLGFTYDGGKIYYDDDCFVIEKDDQEAQALNEADNDLTKDEFESLAESIIDYIDEIGRRKRKDLNFCENSISKELEETRQRKIDKILKK